LLPTSAKLNSDQGQVEATKLHEDNIMNATIEATAIEVVNLDVEPSRPEPIRIIRKINSKHQLVTLQSEAELTADERRER
jgi:hypothetical protein